MCYHVNNRHAENASDFSFLDLQLGSSCSTLRAKLDFYPEFTSDRTPRSIAAIGIDTRVKSTLNAELDIVISVSSNSQKLMALQTLL